MVVRLNGLSIFFLAVNFSAPRRLLVPDGPGTLPDSNGLADQTRPQAGENLWAKCDKRRRSGPQQARRALSRDHGAQPHSPSMLLMSLSGPA